LSSQFSPTAINTDACKLFDESLTPELEGFSSLYNLEYFTQKQMVNKEGQQNPTSSTQPDQEKEK
jgi:hypothetical protein